MSRYDGGRSSLRLDRNRRGVNSDTNSIADKEMDSGQLLRENLDLRHRLEEDEASYRRKLDTYRLAQQHQSTLVSRLQSKVDIVPGRKVFFSIKYREGRRCSK